ncbi:MAG TPA: GerMN domain-containing protein [Candidatus Hydrogenedentes bacterium]|nr:GerMN domain-containing protein [Candidatus Hydrogenedentota bacterium]
MNHPWQQNVMRKLGLAVWSMVTLVLLFCVILLINEMFKAGQDPLASLRPHPKEEPRPASAGKPLEAPGQREIKLFFANADGRLLTPEARSIECGASTVENCRHALEALIAGPQTPLTPVLPANVQIRGLYLLENGEAVLDFSREMISEHAQFSSASMEALMAQAVAHTLAQPALLGDASAPIQRIRFLFEGSPPYETFPAHVDLNDPIMPGPNWLDIQPQEAPGNG